MDSLSSKAAYLKGLCDGLKLDTEKAEGQLISKMIEMLGDLAEAVDDVCDAHDELEDFVRDMDDDLAELEELAYDEDEEEDDDDLSDYDDEDDDMGFFEIQCPNCHEDVMVNFDTLDDEEPIVCPNCHEEIELEFDCDCGCDDCGHDCDDHE